MCTMRTKGIGNRIMGNTLLVFALILGTLPALSTGADEMVSKKAEAEGLHLREENYLVFGVMPSLEGSMDIFLSGQYFFSRKFSSWGEFETTTVITPEYRMEKEIGFASYSFEKEQIRSLRLEPLIFRIVNPERTGPFTLDFCPFVGWEGNTYETRFSHYEALTADAHFYLFSSVQDLQVLRFLVKLKQIWSPMDSLSFRLSQAAGLYYGFLDFEVYAIDESKPSGKVVSHFASDSRFQNPGVSFSLSSSGSFPWLGYDTDLSMLYSTGPVSFVEWMRESNEFTEMQERLELIKLDLRVEMFTPLLKFGSSLPAVYYGISYSAFKVGEENLIIKRDAGGQAFPVIHKVGLTMLF